MLAEAARAGAGARELEGIDFDALPRERQRLVALAIFRRETGIMAVSALVVFGLALRAAGTSTVLYLERGRYSPSRRGAGRLRPCRARGRCR